MRAILANWLEVVTGLVSGSLSIGTTVWLSKQIDPPPLEPKHFRPTRLRTGPAATKQLWRGFKRGFKEHALRHRGRHGTMRRPTNRHVGTRSAATRVATRTHWRSRHSPEGIPSWGNRHKFRPDPKYNRTGRRARAFLRPFKEVLVCSLFGSCSEG